MAPKAAFTGVKKDIKLKRYILNPDMSLIIPQPAPTGEGMRRAVRCPHCFVKCEATDLKIHLEACVSAVALVHQQGSTVMQAPLGKHKHSMTTAFCKINILSRSVGVVHFVGSPGHYTVQLLMKLKDWCSKKWYCTCSPGEEGHTIVAGRGKDGLLVADYGHSTNITLGELTTSLMVCDNLRNLSEIGFERGLKLPDEVDYHLRFGVNHVFAAGRVATHGPPPPVAEVLRTPPCTTTCKTCRTHGCESCRKCPIRRLSGCFSLTHVTCYQPDKTLMKDCAFLVVGDVAYSARGGVSVLFDAASTSYGWWTPPAFNSSCPFDRELVSVEITQLCKPRRGDQVILPFDLCLGL